MRTFLNSLAGTFAAIVLIVLIAAGLAAAMGGKKDKIEDASYLVIELHGDLPEYDPPGGIMSKITGGDTETLTRVLDNLRKARADDRIKGVILQVSASSSFGIASAQEIRGAIKRVQEAGKKVYGYAESFEAREYYLLAACDEIILPETGSASLTGFAANTVHIKLALEKLGIKPNLHKIKDYKAAAELITRTNMSEPARENREWLLAEFWDFFTTEMEKDRGFSEDKVVKLMEHAIFTGEEAKNEGLVDKLMYWDQVGEMLKGEDDDDLHTVSSSRYAEVKTSKLGLDGKKTIAVVHAQGTITGRKSGINPLLGMTMGHDSIVSEISRCRKNEDIAAVILRIDSGGGEGLASDLMGHEVEITAGEKPIIVSMVDVAASGGYLMAYRASKMVADPMTITGSIGSISGKFNNSGMWAKLGVTHDSHSRGPNALMTSSWRDFTPEERARFEDDHWKGFNNWLRDVAEHRGMTFDDAEKLAHGRVFTGRQAVANGLLDDVGDFEQVVAMAKKLADIPDDEKVTLAHFPKKKSLVESILSGDVSAAARWAVYRAVREEAMQTWNVLNNHPELLMDTIEP